MNYVIEAEANYAAVGGPKLLLITVIVEDSTEAATCSRHEIFERTLGSRLDGCNYSIRVLRRRERNALNDCIQKVRQLKVAK